MFSKHRKLKNFLIFPKFQITLFFLNFWVITLSYLILYFVVEGSFSYFDQLSGFVTAQAQPQYYEYLLMYKKHVWTMFISSAIFCYIFTFAFTIYFSHKMAGPVYRMKEFFLNIMVKGEITEKLNFRKNDYYEDLPEIVNLALDKIKK